MNPGTVTVETILEMEKFIGMRHPKFRLIGTTGETIFNGPIHIFQRKSFRVDGRRWTLFSPSLED
jgi:hypothetical protein